MADSEFEICQKSVLKAVFEIFVEARIWFEKKNLKSHNEAALVEDTVELSFDWWLSLSSLGSFWVWLSPKVKTVESFRHPWPNGDLVDYQKLVA